MKEFLFTYALNEYENPAIFETKTEGVWVGSFTGMFSQVEQCIFYLEKGLRVAMVSPELHKRDHRLLGMI